MKNPDHELDGVLNDIAYAADSYRRRQVARLLDEPFLIEIIPEGQREWAARENFGVVYHDCENPFLDFEVPF